MRFWHQACELDDVFVVFFIISGNINDPVGVCHGIGIVCVIRESFVTWSLTDLDAASSSGGNNSSSRGPSTRRSFQHQHSKDQSLYLSADDSRWQQQRRRYSSESSEASEGSTLRRSHDDGEGTDESPSASVSPSTSRRRMSFRSSRKQHQQFYDVDGSDGYDADEQSGNND